MSRFLYLRYIVASAGALGVDMALFLGALALGLPAAAAAALGYCAGIFAHWLLSSRAVFVGRLAGKGRARGQQQALFLGSAFVGLAITTGIVACAQPLGIDPRLAKVVAIGVSFHVTYWLRRTLVFAA